MPALISKWGLGAEMAEWGSSTEEISSDEVYDCLFQGGSIEWNRLSAFQDVTMRLIAEKMLPYNTPVYVQGELVNKGVDLPVARGAYHVYASSANEGSTAFMTELAKRQRWSLVSSRSTHARGEKSLKGAPTLVASSRSPGADENVQIDFNAMEQLQTRVVRWLRGSTATRHLRVSSKLDELQECDHMLVYLNLKTWTSGAKSNELAAEVRMAMTMGVHLLLVHEMPGEWQTARHGCPFSDLFSHVDGATPQDLLARGIYTEIASPLKGGVFRGASMVIVSRVLTGSEPEAPPLPRAFSRASFSSSGGADTWLSIIQKRTRSVSVGEVGADGENKVELPWLRSLQRRARSLSKSRDLQPPSPQSPAVIFRCSSPSSVATAVRSDQHGQAVQFEAEPGSMVEPTVDESRGLQSPAYRLPCPDAEAEDAEWWVESFPRIAKVRGDGLPHVSSEPHGVSGEHRSIRPAAHWIQNQMVVTVDDDAGSAQALSPEELELELAI